MLRTRLIGITSTVPATMQESGKVVKATMRPVYAKSGTADYGAIKNKPSINGVTLEGDISLSELGITEVLDEEIAALFGDSRK